MTKPHIAVLGGGSIGVAFALVFARSGHRVRIYEPSEARRQDVPGEIQDRLVLLKRYGLLDASVNDITARVSSHAQLETAVEDAALVQECIPEDLELKR